MFKIRQVGFALAACIAVAALSGCERLPMETRQVGYRGTGMEQVINPRIVEANAPLHVAPDPCPRCRRWTQGQRYLSEREGSRRFACHRIHTTDAGHDQLGFAATGAAPIAITRPTSLTILCTPRSWRGE